MFFINRLVQACDFKRLDDVIHVSDPFLYGELSHESIPDLLQKRRTYYIEINASFRHYFHLKKQRFLKANHPNPMLMLMEDGPEVIAEATERILEQKSGIRILIEPILIRDLIFASFVATWIDEIGLRYGREIPITVDLLSCFNLTGHSHLLTKNQRSFLTTFWKSYVAGKHKTIRQLLNRDAGDYWKTESLWSEYSLFIPRRKRAHLCLCDQTILSAFRVRKWSPAIDVVRSSTKLVYLVGDDSVLWRLAEWAQLEDGRYLKTCVETPVKVRYRQIYFRLTMEGQRILTSGLSGEDRLTLSPMMGMAY